MQAYIESLIHLGPTRTKLLTFLNQCRSIYGWTILSLASTIFTLHFLQWTQTWFVTAIGTVTIVIIDVVKVDGRW